MNICGSQFRLKVTETDGKDVLERLRSGGLQVSDTQVRWAIQTRKSSAPNWTGACGLFSRPSTSKNCASFLSAARWTSHESPLADERTTHIARGSGPRQIRTWRPFCAVPTRREATAAEKLSDRRPALYRSRRPTRIPAAINPAALTKVPAATALAQTDDIDAKLDQEGFLIHMHKAARGSQIADGDQRGPEAPRRLSRGSHQGMELNHDRKTEEKLARRETAGGE